MQTPGVIKAAQYIGLVEYRVPYRIRGYGPHIIIITRKMRGAGPGEFFLGAATSTRTLAKADKVAQLRPKKNSLGRPGSGAGGRGAGQHHVRAIFADSAIFCNTVLPIT